MQGDAPGTVGSGRGCASASPPSLSLGWTYRRALERFSCVFQRCLSRVDLDFRTGGVNAEWGGRETLRGPQRTLTHLAWSPRGPPAAPSNHPRPRGATGRGQALSPRPGRARGPRWAVRTGTHLSLGQALWSGHTPAARLLCLLSCEGCLVSETTRITGLSGGAAARWLRRGGTLRSHGAPPAQPALTALSPPTQRPHCPLCGHHQTAATGISGLEGTL